MKKIMLAILCLIMLLSFSACHVYIDMDPWPASPDSTDTVPTITQPPTNTPDPSPTPYGINFTNESLPSVTTESPEAVELTPAITPTPEPQHDVVEPGFNG